MTRSPAWPSLSERVALVTGATGGIGRATAVALAAAGAKVVVGGRRDVEGEETVRVARQADGEAHFVRADVTREEDVARLLEVAVDRFGGLHCAVNNAGIDLNVGVMDASEDQFDALVNTNLRGVWLCLRHELRHMRAAGGGAIVNVNSVSGARPTDAQAMYGMTKRGVTHLTQSAAREAGKDGVRVNEILPALLMTEMVRSYFEGPNAIALQPVVDRLALPRAGTPQDGAHAILFLCSEQASYITGASLPVDGGFLLYNAGAT